MSVIMTVVCQSHGLTLRAVEAEGEKGRCKKMGGHTIDIEDGVIVAMVSGKWRRVDYDLVEVVQMGLLTGLFC